MPYDPNEVALLRQLIVEEQKKSKKPRRGKGKCGKTRDDCECSDDELEGGFIGALVGAVARAAVPTLARVATTASRGVSSVASRILPSASRSTAIVPYSAARAAANLSRAAAPSLASRVASTAARTASRVGNVASVGLPIGLSIYQAVDYEKQKKIAEGQAAEADRLNRQALSENQRAVNAEVEYLKEQQRLVELDAKALEEERVRREDEYQRILADQEKERLRQAELERQYQAEAERQYQEMLAYNQRVIEEQIRQQMAAMRPSYSTPSVPTQPTRPSAPTTQPFVPSQPTQPVANPVVDPTAGMTARQRAIYLSQQRSQQRGRGKMVGEGNAWIEALKDWNGAELHRGQMWCLPKKGSKQAKEVKKVMDKIKKGAKPPISKQKEPPKPRGRPKKQVEGQQTLEDLFRKKK